MVAKVLLAYIRDRYCKAVISGETSVAEAIIDEAIRRGATPPEIYLSILAPAQVILGELWHKGEINIAQEHLATAITMQMMDRQRQAAKPRTPLGLRAVASPVEGDQHFVGARMIADLLIMDGWDVDFFWNATPAKDLAEYVQQRRVNIVALSATMIEYLPNVRPTADTIRKLDPTRPKIILGGTAVNSADYDAQELGVDAIVTDVAEAAKQARQLVGYPKAKPTLEQQLTAIGRNIRTARTLRKITQQQLAENAGIDRTYLSLVEHGKQNLTIAAIVKLADALDVHINHLIDTD